MKKILVTGAGGFIGYNLCNYLVDQGHAVTGIDLHFPLDISLNQPTKFTSQVCDFRDQESMKRYLAGIDTIFHLASAHLQVSLEEKEYWDINVYSLPPLLNLAKQAGVKRFVHVSSVGVYGNLKQLPANEETVCTPQSIYGETKLAGEAEVRKFSDDNGFPIVIIRPAWVYGTYCPRTVKIYRALKKGRFFIIGDGQNLRHPLYIADMLEAFRLSMETDAGLGELFVIGGPKAITTNELVDGFCKALDLSAPKLRIPYWIGSIMAWGIESISRLVKIEPPLSKRSLEFFDTNNAFDISKAKSLLGFEPQFSLEDGLGDCRKWLEGNVV